VFNVHVAIIKEVVGIVRFRAPLQPGSLYGAGLKCAFPSGVFEFFVFP
jgi:hypothetical protein